jgi:ATP-dependent Clp protease protease subunit
MTPRRAEPGPFASGGSPGFSGGPPGPSSGSPGFSGGSAGPSGGPGDGAWGDWLQTRLFERRIVILRGPLDELAAGRLAAELMTLDATGDDAVMLHIDSAGGPTHAAFTVIDTMDLLGVPVHTVCVGRAEGTAVGVVAAGVRRHASPNARFHLREPDTTISGTAGQMAVWAAEHQASAERFVTRLAAATRRPVEHLEADLASGRWLDATRATAYGIVDGLWSPPRGDRLGGPGGSPLGFSPGGSPLGFGPGGR